MAGWCPRLGLSARAWATRPAHCGSCHAFADFEDTCLSGRVAGRCAGSGLCRDHGGGWRRRVLNVAPRALLTRLGPARFRRPRAPPRAPLEHTAPARLAARGRRASGVQGGLRLDRGACPSARASSRRTCFRGRWPLSELPARASDDVSWAGQSRRRRAEWGEVRLQIGSRRKEVFSVWCCATPARPGQGLSKRALAFLQYLIVFLPCLKASGCVFAILCCGSTRSKSAPCRLCSIVHQPFVYFMYLGSGFAMPYNILGPGVAQFAIPYSILGPVPNLQHLTAFWGHGWLKMQYLTAFWGHGWAHCDSICNTWQHSGAGLFCHT